MINGIVGVELQECKCRYHHFLDDTIQSFSYLPASE